MRPEPPEDLKRFVVGGERKWEFFFFFGFLEICTKKNAANFDELYQL